MKILESLEKRYSAYNLDKTSALSNEEIVALVKQATTLTPSAFNAQTQRVVILFGEKSNQFWDLTREAVRKVAPAEGFERTAAKLENFKAQGTLLFYSDQTTVKNLQQNFALYAENFPVWAEQESGMLQLVIWSALAEKGIGASLQHYNPVVDADVAKEFGIDQGWKLVAQMPFGGDRGTKETKEKLPIESRVIVKE